MPVREFTGALDPAPREPLVTAFSGYTDEEKQNASASTGDVARSFGAGAAEGTGYIFKGGGDALAAAVNYLGRKAGFDPQLRAENPLQSAADWLRSGMTEPGKIAMSESEITGDITQPSTWGFRGKPSVSGVVGNAANALGQFVPNLGVAIATGGSSVPVQLGVGAGVGGAQAYGAASEEERRRVLDMSLDELSQVPMFQRLTAQGMSPDQARVMVAESAGVGGGFGNAIPSALEGAAESVLIPRLLGGRIPIPAVFGKGGRAGRTATGAVGGFATGGAEEALERAAQTYGANRATGEARPLGTDTLGEFVYGGMAEGTVGGAFGAMSSGNRMPEPTAQPQTPRDDLLARTAAQVVQSQRAKMATVAPAAQAPASGQEAPAEAAASEAPTSAYPRELDALRGLAGGTGGLTDEDTQFLTGAGLARQKKDGTFGILPAGRRRLKALESALDQAAHEAATSPANDLPEPTDAQKDAGNYKLGHINVGGLDVSVENPAGSTRRAKADAPVQWETEMQDHYGYVKGVPARAPDKDHVDLFVKPSTPEDYAGNVFVIDQNNEDGTFDEPKVMVGYASRDEAVQAYLRNYQPGWESRVRGVTELPMAEFKRRLQDERAFMDAQPEAQPLKVEGEGSVLPSTDVRAAAAPSLEAPASGGTAAASTAPERESAPDGNQVDAAQSQPQAEANAQEIRDDRTQQPAEPVPAAQPAQPAAEAPGTEAAQAEASVAKKAVAAGEKKIAVGDIVEWRHGSNGKAVRAEVVEAPAWTDALQVRITEHPIRSQVGNTVTQVPSNLTKVAQRAQPATSEPEQTTAQDDIAQWYDKDLTPEGRRQVRLAAGLSKNSTVLWNYVNEGDRAKLAAIRGTEQDPIARDAKRAESGRAPQRREQLTQVARRRGILVNEARGGFHAGGDGIAIPAEDQQVEGALSANHVFAHELGHAIVTKRGLSYKGFPVAEMRKRISNWDALREASVNFRPAVHGHADERIRKYAKRSEEILADAIGAVIMGEQPLDLLKPWMESTGTTEIDLGLKEAPAAEAKPDKAKIVPKRTEDGGVRYVAEPVESGTAPEQKPVSDAVEKAFGDGNKVFTKDAAEAARERLRKKLGTVRSGIDPEMLLDGMTLAGYYIEGGARAFADYSAKMIADLGEAARPYLKSWYLAVRNYPGFDNAGMQTEAELDALAETPAAVDTGSSNEPDHGRTDEQESVSAERRDEDRGDGGDRGRRGEPVDAGVAAPGEGDAGQRDLSGPAEGAGGEGNRSTVESGERAPGTSRNPADAQHQPRSAEGVADFEIDASELGRGGLAKKYRDNVAAIKTIKTLEAEGRKATAEERAAIAKYVGWGGLKGVFDPDNKQWSKEHAELKALLTPDEWKAAAASMRNAHYTSPTVVNAMYRALQNLGFNGGRVLEPSVGVGNFFGLMPRDMRGASTLFGVELDVLTSKIAAYLYPNARISQATPFQNFQIPAGFFDLAIGNPPFGSEPIVDEDRSAYSGFSIHNYFFAKAIDKLRPGGLLAMVVSHNFLDRMNPAVRNWIAQRADLVSAARLPNTAFKENANTEVVTDIVILKRVEERPIPKAPWLETKTVDVVNPETGETTKAEVNRYFIDNPKNVLGKQSAAGSMYRANEYTVEPTGDLEKQLEHWTVELPEALYEPIERGPEALDKPDVAIPDGVKVGSFYVTDKGVVMQRLPDALGKMDAQVWEAPNATAEKRMLGMIDLRSKLRAQMRLERDPQATEKVVESNRKKLNAAYDAFVKQFGYLNSQTNRRIFLDDPEAPLLQALEVDYDGGLSKSSKAVKDEGAEPREPSAKKADILSRRVLFPPQDAINVTNAKDALLASLNIKGRMDMDYIRQVYDKPEAEILSELGDVVYEDPANGWQHADEYLSGDVKTKLEEAKHVAKNDARFQRNVDALEKIIPADLLPSQIYAAPGAAWVPHDVYEDFLREVSGHKTVSIRYIPATAQWIVNASDTPETAKETSEFGTTKLGATRLWDIMLNGRSPVVHKTISDEHGKAKSVVDEEATEQANERFNKMRAHWDSWVWKDGERSSRLAGIYNDRHNRTVERRYDGAHMTFPGMSPAITLWPSQKDVVWRGVQDRVMLMDHVVGAGKTFAGAALAMEMRRLGIARKPLFAVPNHLTLAWRQEFYRLYPGANVLAATPEDFSKDNRKKLFSKIVTGNWDAVIVGHSSMKKIGLPPETEKRILEEQLNEIADAIEQLKRERGDRNIVRDMEKIKANLDAKLKTRQQKVGKRDDVVTFDELGVDALFVDEFHEFKNLFFTTQKQRVSGLGNPTGSSKAFDMFVKIQWLVETFGEQAPLITMTGTPVSNSLAEMFTVQRYMQYPQLKRDGLHLFDAWAKMFGDDQAVYEVAPSGVGYRVSTRFAKFKNLPALMGYYHTFADVITLDDLKEQAAAEGKRFPVPKIKGGRPQNVVAKKSPLQNEFIGEPVLVTDEDGTPQFKVDPEKEFALEKSKDGDKWVLRTAAGSQQFETEEEAKLEYVAQVLTPVIGFNKGSLLSKFANLRELMRKTKGKVNALSLTNLANKVALDYRLINPAAPDFEGSKINEAVDRMLRLYRQWTADKGTQLVFCDLSVPLSARSKMAARDARLYVRDPQTKALTHKRGTLHTVEGFEGFPFYLVGEGRGGVRTFTMYDPVSGMQMRTGFKGKAEAQQFVQEFLSTEANRDRWMDYRDSAPRITEEELEDYKNEHEIDSSDEGGAEISQADIEGMASATAFSVYDDIKEKLVKGGVPAREIAFIHDFDTPKAKLELYKRVNRGDVRFLFGSTPKLGAGTNVQERLVGLHHIDAPWRPSDLEQREGRIVRQGNKLYERDPDGFEVEINRYATEQTYDTRRWQILEHKAAGVEQMRKYGGELEMEDVASEASNAAEMKAAASGSPLILKETELRNEVRRLENLRKGHADELFARQRQYQSNQSYIDKYGPATVRKYTALKDTVDRHPVPEEGLPAFTVNGKTYADKEKAAGALTQAYALAESGPSTITYRGLEFVMDVHSARFVQVVEQDTGTVIGTWDLRDKDDKFSPSGLLTRFANFVDRIPADIASAERHIARARAENEQLKPLLNVPYAHEDELQRAKAEHVRVQRQLMKEDIATAIKPAERAKIEAAMVDRKRILREKGFEDALREFEGPAGQSDTPAYQRTQGHAFAQQALEELATVDELFRYPVSQSKNLETVFSEVAPAFRFVGNDTRPDEDHESGADRRYLLRNEQGHDFYVYERGRDVWIDVSRFEPGEGGAAVYAAVLNYAHNAGKRLVGDPDGLTKDAVIRRTSAMLSSALRFGTTRHMEAAPEQRAGDAAQGIAPLDWSGTDVERTRSLIDTFLSTLHNQVPGIEDYRYDFTRNKFVDGDGRVIERGQFERRADSGVGREGRAGADTLRRGILLQSLVSSSRSAQPGILGQVLRRARQMVTEGDLGAAFSRESGREQPGNVAAVRAAVDAITRDWTNKPKFVITDTPAEWGIGAPDNAAGAHWRGTVYLAAAQLGNATKLRRAVMHETTHYAISSMGNEIVPALKHVWAVNPKVRRATADWIRLNHDVIRKARMTKVQARLRGIDETLANMAGHGEKINGLQRVIAAIQKWLRAHNFNNVANWLESLSHAEALSLLADARRHVEQGDEATFHVFPTAETAGSPALSRASDANTTETPALSRAGDETRQQTDTEGGTFDASNADIRYARAADMAEMAERARHEIGDLFTSSRTFNRFLKGFQTQFHKAWKDRDFKRVFDIGQEYLTDTSRYSMMAEGQAPSLLLRMEGIKDIFKSRISDADAAAIAKPVFEGTLTDEKVYSDNELREQFGLNDQQIGYYREFRAGVDRSLDELTKSTLAKMARAIGVSSSLIHTLRRRETTLSEFHRIVQRAMKDRVKLLEKLAEGADGIAKRGYEQQVKTAQSQIRETSGVYNRIAKLKQQGYAPLMRFGEYTVDVVDTETGEREFFGMYESQRAANKAAKALAAEFPDSDITQGVLSKEASKVFQGLSPDTVEVFAKHLGLEEQPLFQQYLKIAVSNRSALKRLIKRKGVPGFSEDVTRVLASFITSNARLTSSNYHLGDMRAAVDEIPQKKGDVKDEAVRLWDYLTNPKEEAGALRGFMFFNFLGGSVASALVNMTQPLTMTAPYLSQYADGAKVSSEMLRAAKDASRNSAPRDMQAAYKRALEEGVIAPHEIHQLMAEARGGVGRSVWLARTLRVWGAFFSLAEVFNRRITFIAAYRIGLDQGMTGAQAYDFARNAVNETQGLYNKGNRPNYARGAVGATVFTFKQFSIAYLEFLKRLPTKQRLIALAILFLAAGIEGLPFAEDIEDIIDTVGQWLGHGTNTKKWLRQNAVNVFGEGIGNFIDYGVSSVLPLDVHLRMGLGNLIPGTSALKLSETDRARDALEVIGPAGGMLRSGADFLSSAARGDVGRAARSIMPVAVQNAVKGLEMWESGEYKDTQGRKVMDVDGVDAFIKGVGFQPSTVAMESAKIGQNIQDINLAKATEDALLDRWARAVVEDKRDDIDDVRADLKAWNERNPSIPIRIKPEQIRSRIAQMRRTREERVLKTASPEMRGSLR